MARFVKGDVVVLPFPFSDLSRSKRRPAVVVASLDGDDLILVQVTSQTVRDHYSVGLVDGDFTEGGLRRPSNIRPNKLFTADQRLILNRAGKLKNGKCSEIIETLVEILTKE